MACIIMYEIIKIVLNNDFTSIIKNTKYLVQ